MVRYSILSEGKSAETACWKNFKVAHWSPDNDWPGPALRLYNAVDIPTSYHIKFETEEDLLAFKLKFS